MTKQWEGRPIQAEPQPRGFPRPRLRRTDLRTVAGSVEPDTTMGARAENPLAPPRASGKNDRFCVEKSLCGMMPLR